MYLGATDLNVMARQEIEAKIVEKIVDEALRKDYALSIQPGAAEISLERSKDKAAILNELMECDDDIILVHTTPESRRGFFVYLVYGNDGWDVICDHATSLEAFLKPASDLAATFEEWDSWPTARKAQLVAEFNARKDQIALRKALTPTDGTGRLGQN